MESLVPSSTLPQSLPPILTIQTHFLCPSTLLPFHASSSPPHPSPSYPHPPTPSPQVDYLGRQEVDAGCAQDHGCTDEAVGQLCREGRSVKGGGGTHYVSCTAHVSCTVESLSSQPSLIRTTSGSLVSR